MKAVFLQVQALGLHKKVFQTPWKEPGVASIPFREIYPWQTE